MSVQLHRPAPGDQRVDAAAPGQASDRFTVQRVDGELTVWDAERRRHLLHEKRWDEKTADEVAASLAEHPNYVACWDWSEPWA